MNEADRAGQPALSSFVGAVLIAVALGCASGCNQDRAEAVQQLNEGIELYRADKTGQAVDRLEEAQKLDPTFAQPPLQLGQMYHRKMNDLDRAEEAYREALQRDPESAEIAYKLGAVLADADDHSEAINQFEQAVEREEKHAKAWYRLGLSHREEGEYPEAVEAFTESIRANPRMRMDDGDSGGMAYHELGDLYNWFGFYDKALEVYENGIENNEDAARLHGGRGVAQLKLERHDEAIDSFEKALELESRNTTASYNLAAAYQESGRYDRAIEVLEEFIDRTRDDKRRAAAEGVLAQLRAERDEDSE